MSFCKERFWYDMTVPSTVFPVLLLHPASPWQKQFWCDLSLDEVLPTILLEGWVLLTKKKKKKTFLHHCFCPILLYFIRWENWASISLVPGALISVILDDTFMSWFPSLISNTPKVRLNVADTVNCCNNNPCLFHLTKQIWVYAHSSRAL